MAFRKNTDSPKGRQNSAGRVAPVPSYNFHSPVGLQTAGLLCRLWICPPYHSVTQFLEIRYISLCLSVSVWGPLIPTTLDQSLF